MKYPNRLNTTREREELTGRCLLGTMERTIPKTIAKRRESESQRCIEVKWGRDRDRCSRRRIKCKIQENRGTKITKITLGQKTNKNSRKKEKQIKKRKRMRKRKGEKKREKLKRKWEIIILFSNVPEQAGRTAPPQKRTSQRQEIIVYMLSRKVTGVAKRHPKKAKNIVQGKVRQGKARQGKARQGKVR